MRESAATRTETSRATGRTWAGFYHAHENRTPHRTLLAALARAPIPGDAVDLGYGSGNETLHLLGSGWNVLAIDRQPEAAALLEQRIPAHLRPAIEIRVAGFEDVALPPADLLFAGFSLPFCHPSRFEALWTRVRDALRPGGRFAGQLFGIEDDWSQNAKMTFHSRSRVERLFDGFDVENLDEVCGPGRSYDGPKQWHVFHVVARKA
jgi:SAM-dependent methyltransferase